jgi:two-component system, NtrC family, response regulator AtoC
MPAPHCQGCHEREERIAELEARVADLERLGREAAYLRDAAKAERDLRFLTGESRAMKAVRLAIQQVARTDSTALIVGETGTGKELVARAIHQLSPRRDRLLVAVNCAALAPSLIPSELFGHEPGAFTGATRRRTGRFELAHKGTLFLDEVGELPLETQVLLLRALQERVIERVGGGEPIPVDVRVIAATHRDLAAAVGQGRFRADLFFRLNVFPIGLPPLRERGDDLALLVEYFLRRFGRELDKPVPAVPPETFDALRRYDWPGNVRELQSALKQALLQMSGTVLLPEFLPAALRAPAPSRDGADAANGEVDRLIQDRLAAGAEDLYAECLALMERRLLTRVLQHTGGNQVQAARILGITRGSLRTKIRALGITIGRAVWTDDDQPE